MDATNVYGDRFWVCRIASISYRIYASKQTPDAEAQGCTPDALQRAEVASRKDSQRQNGGSRFHVSLSPSGRELWAYSWEEVPSNNASGNSVSSTNNTGNGVPINNMTNSTATNNAAFNSNGGNGESGHPLESSSPIVESIADTTAQGVFLPPFTAASASPNDDHPEARYGPLLRAIESCLSDSSLRNGDRAQYEAFGSSAALSTGDGSIVRFSPSLYQHGALVVRITQQRSLLMPPPVSSLQFCSPSVWLLPHGRPCRLIARNDSISTTGNSLTGLSNTSSSSNNGNNNRGGNESVEPPNPRRARASYSVSKSQFVSNATSAELEESQWLRVSCASSSQDLLWPVVLIRATPSTTSSSVCNNSIAHNAPSNDLSALGAMQAHLSVHNTYPHRLPLVALSRDSPYSALTTSMGNVRQELLITNSRTQSQEPGEEWKSGSSRTGRGLNQPISPPPPSPRSGSTRPQSRSPTVQPTSSQTTHSQPSLMQDPAQNMATNSSSFQPPFSQPASVTNLANLGRRTSAATSHVGGALTAHPGSSPAVPPVPTHLAAGQQVVYPTPIYQTPTYHTPTYQTPVAGSPGMDSYMDVENDINDGETVMDADFNFFDLPVGKSTADANKEGSSHLEIEEIKAEQPLEEVKSAEIHEPASRQMSVASTDLSQHNLLPPPNQTPENVNSPEEKEHVVSPSTVLGTKFGYLDLHSSNLDAKYQSGGRFFMAAPAKSDDEDDSKDDSQTNNKDNINEMSDIDLDKSEDDSSDGESSDGSYNSDAMYDGDELPLSSTNGNTLTAGQHVLTPGYENIDSRYQSPQYESASSPGQQDLEAGWSKTMKNEDFHSYLPIDNSKFMSFRNLLSQMVWDGGLLSEMYDTPFLEGEIGVAPQHVIQRLGLSMVQLPICPDPRIFEGAVSPTSSAISNGDDQKSSELNPQQSQSQSQSQQQQQQSQQQQQQSSVIAQKQVQQQRQQQKLQLLSPPFVNVHRGNQDIKARISILNFWRSSGLSPPTNLQPQCVKKDTTVTVISITLASPAIAEAAREFLDRSKSVYDECKLGNIDLPTFGDVCNGLLLIPADLRRTSGDAVGDLYQSSASLLKSQLLKKYRYNAPEESMPQNFSFVISYPPSSLRGGTLTAVVPFQIAQGFEAIQAEFPQSQWLSSSLDLSVSRWDHAQEISSYNMQKVALLAYGRFPSLPHPFQLVGLAPQSSGLQFTPDIPPVLMEDENFLHVAYLLVAGRWCLISWTDQWARKVRIDVSRVKDLSERGSQMSFLEIWRLSVALTVEISDRSGWRFGITRCGMMNKVELAVWKRIVAPNVAVLLMDVPHPRGIRVGDNRQFKSTISTVQNNANAANPEVASAVASSVESESSVTDNSATKQNSPNSPNSASPGTSTKPSWPADGVILNEADEVYGISMEPPQPGVGRFTPSLSRGFLLRPEIEGKLMLETRLLHIKDLKVSPKVAMSRVIGQFRRLASSSEYSGVTTQCTLIPWHIVGLTKSEAAASKLNMM